MKYKHILFDLDGTLTDPAEGITNSIRYSLAKLGLEDRPKESLFCFIGPPLLESYRKYFGFSDEQAQEALRLYREYFSVKGLFENKVYDGIINCLEKLKKSGCKLYIATSKPEKFSKEIIEHFKLDKYFDFIGGSTMSETRVHKADVINYVIESVGIDNVSDAVMLGDRDLDIIGAAKCGMQAIGVLYGYGSLEEHEKAGAVFVAETPEAAADFILGDNQ